MGRANNFFSVAKSVSVFLLIVIANMTSAATADTGSNTDHKKPRIAYVVSEEAEVRSGPSFSAYAADLLTRGQRVEIYRHKGDWYGIRPTKNCFSWIRADHVTVSDDGTTAQVRLQRAKVWIGALNAQDEHRFQLEIHQGDELQLIEIRPRSERDSDSAESRWLKIAPPAGEFRWIHEKLVHIPRSSAITSDHSDDPPKNPNAPWSGRDNGKEAGEASIPTTLEDAILALRIAVSQTVALPIEDWNIDSLLSSADQLKARANSTWQRGQVARVLNSIKELKALKRKHGLLQDEASTEPRRLDETRLVRIAEPIWLASSTSDIDSESGPADDIGLTTATVAATVAGASEPGFQRGGETFRAHYDAVGRIMPVHTTKRHTPPFSVLDDQGRLLHLLTPAPGLNVRRLERQRVGIIGKRTTVEIDGRKFSHLMAEKVIVLERKSSGFPFSLANLPWLVGPAKR
jgi:SH3-like domain-containing protein